MYAKQLHALLCKGYSVIVCLTMLYTPTARAADKGWLSCLVPKKCCPIPPVREHIPRIKPQVCLGCCCSCFVPAYLITGVALLKCYHDTNDWSGSGVCDRPSMGRVDMRIFYSGLLTSAVTSSIYVARTCCSACERVKSD